MADHFLLELELAWSLPKKAEAFFLAEGPVLKRNRRVGLILVVWAHIPELFSGTAFETRLHV